VYARTRLAERRRVPETRRGTSPKKMDATPVGEQSRDTAGIDFFVRRVQRNQYLITLLRRNGWLIALLRDDGYDLSNPGFFTLQVCSFKGSVSLTIRYLLGRGATLIGKTPDIRCQNMDLSLGKLIRMGWHLVDLTIIYHGKNVSLATAMQPHTLIGQIARA